jgi:hypothetical protein
LFYLFLLNSKQKLVIYDLSKYTYWYDFNFKKNKKIIHNKIALDKKKKLYNYNFKLNKIKRLTKLYKTYNSVFVKLAIKLNFLYKNIFLLSFKDFKLFKFKFNMN